MSRFSRTAQAQFEYNATPNSDGDPDVMYLNMDIINNNTLDPQAAAEQDPQIRFNETRDAPIVKDASKYQFSIVRFSMSGANKDLPLFIPVVKTSGAPPVGVLPQNFTEYETAISYEQEWVTTNQPGGITFTITPAVNPIVYVSETQNPVLAPLPRDPTISGQDLTSRYYWVYTYAHWVDLTNQALQTAHAQTFADFQTAWTAAATGDAFPYADLAAWEADVGVAPYMTYDEDTGLFSIFASTRSFGERTSAFVPPGGAPSATTAPVRRLFFDSNMFGIYGNFDNTFYGGPAAGAQGPFAPLPTPVGYVNEILFENKHWTNIQDLVTGAPAYVPASQQDYYWIATQDYESTSSLWSPISSIVFTSTLLPIRNEATGQPIVFGNGNLGYSSSAIQNAFQPIVTDIALDLANDGADAYRKMIYYAPQAEYRMASLAPSRQPVNAIDIQVFWKNRLTGDLVPLTMFNLSSVHVKVMFRRIHE
jgi:hypothetical protein